MKSFWRNPWLWAGVLTYLLFLLINVPASVLTTPLAKRGVQISSSDGSLWHGHVTGLQVGMLNLGELEWRWRFLSLLTGKLGAQVKLTQPQGYAEARVSAGLGMNVGGKITLNNLSASLPLQTLLGRGGLPGGWTGTAQLKFSELVLAQGWPVAAQGSLDIADLTGPASNPANLGAYRIQFSGDDPPLSGQLKALDNAAIDVTGTLKLAPDRSYVLDTLVGMRNNTPASIAQATQYLGPPDAQGRRQFSVSGTL